MKVLLVQPRHRPGLGFKSVMIVEPLGLEMIAAAIEPQHEVRIVDLLKPGTLHKVAQAFSPQACGISCSFTVDVPKTLEIARYLKSLDTNPFVFIGGHHASLSPQDFFVPAVDAIVVGEGEAVASELLNAVEQGQSLKDIRGLVINSPDAQIATLRKEMITDLDDLPHPARHLTKPWRKDYFMGLLTHTASLETARGCPFHCNFCSVWNFFQGKCRFKTPQRVVDEISELDEPHIFVTDDNFLANHSRAKEIAGLIRERGIRKTFSIQARTDTIAKHPDLISDWKSIGLDGIFLGLESINAENMSKFAKANTVENNEIALQILKTNNVGTMGSMIVDPDWDTTDFAKLREYICRHPLDTPSFTILTPLPGTPLFDQFKDRLTTNRFELFDLMHAVLPTRLDLPTFYREYATLYSSCYSFKYLARMVLQSIKGGMGGRRPPLSHIWRLASSTRFFVDAKEYLSAHSDEPSDKSVPLPEKT